MKQRMVSESILQCNFQGQPSFTAHAKYLAFLASPQKQESVPSIKIKSFCKGLAQSTINLQQPAGSSTSYTFFFTRFQKSPYLMVYDKSLGKLEVMIVKDNGKQIEVERLNIFENILGVAENQDFLLLLKNTSKNQKEVNILGYNFEQNLMVDGIGKISKQLIERLGQILSSQGKNIYYTGNSKNFHGTKSLTILQKTDLNLYHQTVIEFQTLKKVLAIYKDRLIFLKSDMQKHIEIFDRVQNKIIGKFDMPEGTLVHIEIKDNILLIVCNACNVDRYSFFVLNQQLDSPQKLIKNSCLFEKCKGSYFSLQNYLVSEIYSLMEGKIKYFSEGNTKVSLIYMIPMKREKVELIKITHDKLRDPRSGEQRAEEPNLKLVQNEEGEESLVQGQTPRKKCAKIEKNEWKAIERLIDSKMKTFSERFNSIENKLIDLEEKVNNISAKIEKSITDITRQQLDKNISNIFEEVTPQFQTYFNEVFSQISGVINQGEQYYKNKLANQVNTHIDILSKMVNLALSGTKQVKKANKQMLNLSQITHHSLYQFLQSYEKWKQNNRNLTHEDNRYLQNERQVQEIPIIKFQFNSCKVHNGKARNL